MQSDLQRLLQLDFFRQEGFTRKQCSSCGAHFWTTDDRQELCGDAPCVPYSFIGSPLGSQQHTLSSMREAFLSFFEERGHTRLRRYPVVARWRSDVYLTIASIADFQPHVTSGQVPPPANPLVISQPSIRLNDLEEVGRSGRHLTMFEMMGHHAFNNHGEVYWSEETARYCHHFLDQLGVPAGQVTYKEGEWFGGGNAGACLEVLAAGMEVATLVFMSLERHDRGPYEVNGERYREMPLRVVDTGYGLERLVWLTRGSPTVYDAIFPSVIEFLRRESGAGEEGRRDIYALADHARCLAFMLSDGIVPSNVEEGYLARLLIRRALRFLSHLGLDLPLFDIVDLHVRHLGEDFPELFEGRETMRAMLDKEAQKYRSTLDKGRRLVARYVREEGNIPADKLIQFYDTYGLPPEVVKEVAGDAVEIPQNFDSMVAELHSHAAPQTQAEETSDFHTQLLFYRHPYQARFEARAVWSGDVDGQPAVILDRTLFYPQGGGQTSDLGILEQKKVQRRVLRAQKRGEAVVHVLDGPLKKGPVTGAIDWERRMAVMRHHTATHVVNAAARHVLGGHIWQKGSQLDEREARLDVSHYQRISPEEIAQIEREAHRMVMAAKPVVKSWLPRNQAEQEYGMRLYQGGAPKGNLLRVVRIPDEEVEACGGTHVDNTAELGLIKIVGTERIQDGVERLRFKAGYAALDHVHGQEELLQKTADALSVDIPVLPDTARRFFSEWKQLRKQVEDLQKMVAEGGGASEDHRGVRIVTQDGLTSAAIREITARGDTVVVSADSTPDAAKLTIAASEGLGVDCGAVAKEVGALLEGSGGGKPGVAQAGGPRVEQLSEARERAVALLKKQLDAR